MVDGISGISSGGGDETEESIESRIRGVSDLKDLADLISDDDVADGIRRELNGDGFSIEQDTAIGPTLEQEITIEQQLEELEDINDQVVLLRDINKQLIKLNEKQETANDILLKTLEEVSTPDSGVIKDIDHRTISQAQKQQDLAEEEDIESVSVRVKADPTNDSFLYIGLDDITIRNGFRLEPGESEVFNLDLSENELQVVSEEAGDSYSYITRGVK